MAYSTRMEELYEMSRANEINLANSNERISRCEKNLGKVHQRLELLANRLEQVIKKVDDRSMEVNSWSIGCASLGSFDFDRFRMSSHLDLDARHMIDEMPNSQISQAGIVLSSNLFPVPEFHGINPREWIYQANLYFKNSVEDWNGFEKVKYAYYFMFGPAETWFIETFTVESKEHWECFCEKMLDRFDNPFGRKKEVVTYADAFEMFDEVLLSETEMISSTTVILEPLKMQRTVAISIDADQGRRTKGRNVVDKEVDASAYMSEVASYDVIISGNSAKHKANGITELICLVPIKDSVQWEKKNNCVVGVGYPTKKSLPRSYMEGHWAHSESATPVFQMEEKHLRGYVLVDSVRVWNPGIMTIEKDKLCIFEDVFGTCLTNQNGNAVATGSTSLKSSLHNPVSDKADCAIKWADKQMDIVQNVCEYLQLQEKKEAALPSSSPLEKEMGEEESHRFVSVEACAIGLTRAAEVVASGKSDVPDALCETCIIILPHSNSMDESNILESAYDVETDPKIMKWPKNSGFSNDDLLNSEDFWYETPPEGFNLTLSPFPTMFMALFSWLSSSSPAYVYGRDESSHTDFLFVNGREYPCKFVHVSLFLCDIIHVTNFQFSSSKILEKGGILHAEENDYKTSYSYFFEEFEAFNALEDTHAIYSLKYMLPCQIMVNQIDDVAGIISSPKVGLQYQGPEINAMKVVTEAHSKHSLKLFESALKNFKTQLDEDLIVHRHPSYLYDTLLEQNLCRLIEPFSSVEISHVAELIEHPAMHVEKKLSQIILDKKFEGTLDHGAGCMIIFEDPNTDAFYPATLETIESIGGNCVLHCWNRPSGSFRDLDQDHSQFGRSTHLLVHHSTSKKLVVACQGSCAMVQSTHELTNASGLNYLAIGSDSQHSDANTRLQFGSSFFIRLWDPWCASKLQNMKEMKLGSKEILLQKQHKQELYDERPSRALLLSNRIWDPGRQISTVQDLRTSLFQGEGIVVFRFLWVL